MFRSLALLSLLVLSLTGTPVAASTPRYSALDLGAGVTGADLNASGQVVGSAPDATGDLQAFITGANGRGLTLLGTLGGTSSAATAVNDAGWVVGWSLLAGDPRSSPRHAFVTGADGHDLRDLGSLGGLDPYGHDVGYATAITADGRVAGFGYAPDFEPRIFVTGPGGQGMTAFSVGGNPTYGAALNERGQIAGSFNDGKGTYYAFVTGPDGSAVHVLAPGTDLLQPVVSAVDAQGRVVGGYWYPDGAWPRAFLTGEDGSGMRDLGTLGGLYSVAYDLTLGAVVVGQAGTADGALHAFITAAGGTAMQDLNDLVALDGVTLASAVAINERGQVLANSDTGHAWLLTPVPEPAPWLLGLAGGALLLLRRVRRTLPLGLVVCAVQAAPRGGYEVVTVESALDTLPQKQLIATCPAGKRVLGAGWAAVDVTNAIMSGRATYFMPSYDGAGWLANVALEGGAPDEWKMQLRLLCARVPS